MCYPVLTAFQGHGCPVSRGGSLAPALGRLLGPSSCCPAGPSYVHARRSDRRKCQAQGDEALMSAVSGPPGVREPHRQDPAPPSQARRWETPRASGLAAPHPHA